MIPMLLEREVEGVKVTLEPQEKVKRAPCHGGGFYQHELVKLGDRVIGRVQVRERNVRFGRIKRRETDVLTLDEQGACVRGFDLAWLVRRDRAAAASAALPAGGA